MDTNINIILNGKNVTGNKGESVLELAKRYGYEIPTLCNDKRLEPYTSCYLCVVEITGMRGLQPACSTIISEGMDIKTSNDKVFKARKTALDLIMSNHYADCLGPCKQACPAGVDVQGYIALIEKEKFSEAVALIKETNPLPAICGRVCVRPCEVACRRNLMDEGNAVGIDYLKRFASDFDLNSKDKYRPVIKPSTGKKIAIIGAGPGGLSAAFFLQKEGHQTDIYEAQPKAGGWLRYGIPEYRLPNDLLQKEVDNITELGVNIYYNQKLGDNLSYQTLKFKYDAIILAIGSQAGTGIGCEGDNAGNVFSGVDFLKKMELTGEKLDFKGKTVGVIGGGNTAMDCCRTAIRFGAEKVYVVYRRTEKEMPANPIEIHESKLEGVEYLFLTAPVKVNADEKGNIKSLKCIKMGLGEPDASGRRRPVPIENSEFDVEMDIALAAIGQKTVVDFMDDVNKHTTTGELKVNKWGDIDADPNTLQTGIKNMFACGDGVTGPATLIQAVAQARIAAQSCNQFLNNEAIKPDKSEFLSKKDNFKKQESKDYVHRFKTQSRHEMPTLKPEERNNFNEVELGYENKEVALHEASRCIECGCSAYFDCDLKRYATEYNAEQSKFKGDYVEYQVDFRHPYIEIDNNKCILCSRCVRICRDVVQANALGLINRGFKTFVAPSMNQSLLQTDCESCGMCISTCPTGAISENTIFKPGPFKTDSFNTICNYCSVGCTLEVQHKKDFVVKVKGAEGKVNSDTNICRYGRFGYKYYNRADRIVRPLVKTGNEYKEISFDEALDIIDKKIRNVNPGQNGFFAGARLTNEEMYMVQKLARKGASTNNIASFYYLEGDDFRHLADKNVPFEQLHQASKIWLMGAEINKDNPVFGFMVNNAHKNSKIPLLNISVKPNNTMIKKVDENILIKDYYSFIRAVNHYLLKNNKQNMLFIKDHCKGFDDYKSKILGEDYASLVNNAVSDILVLEQFADDYNTQMNAVLIFSENELSPAACLEARNLAILTGKLGKTASGIISLKVKNNSQGLFDMGIGSSHGTGNVRVDDENYISKINSIWNISKLPSNETRDMKTLLEGGLLKNAFIFGEDPLGCAVNKNEIDNWFNQMDFIMVQDYFFTETALKADLILPASIPAEIGGSFTNTSKIIQKFDKVDLFQVTPEMDSINQLIALNRKFGNEQVEDSIDITMEAIKFLSAENQPKLEFITMANNKKQMFTHGCDYLMKMFDDEFFKNTNNK